MSRDAINDFKLCIELVPKSLWRLNPRRSMGYDTWDKLRRNVYAKYDHKCAICGDTSRLNCHEVWHYDDEKHIQTLRGFVALCDMCHHVKHIGKAGALYKEGKLDFERVISHFMKVNQCTVQDFHAHYTKSFELWHARNEYKWETNWGAYSHLIKGE